MPDFLCIFSRFISGLHGKQAGKFRTSLDGSERRFGRHTASQRLQLGLEFPYTQTAHGGGQVHMDVLPVGIAADPLKQIRHFLYG